MEGSNCMNQKVTVGLPMSLYPKCLLVIRPAFFKLKVVSFEKIQLHSFLSFHRPTPKDVSQ
jgi:hypothetical protein